MSAMENRIRNCAIWFPFCRSSTDKGPDVYESLNLKWMDDSLAKKSRNTLRVLLDCPYPDIHAMLFPDNHLGHLNLRLPATDSSWKAYISTD